MGDGGKVGEGDELAWVGSDEQRWAVKGSERQRWAAVGSGGQRWAAAELHTAYS